MLLRENKIVHYQNFALFMWSENQSLWKEQQPDTGSDA